MMDKLEEISSFLLKRIDCGDVECSNCPFDEVCQSAIGIETKLSQAVKERTNKVNSRVKLVGKIKKEQEKSHTTPSHYDMDPEPIAVIKAWNLDFCLGNVVKYIARAGKKPGESKDKDLHKAMDYLRKALEDER